MRTFCFLTIFLLSLALKLSAQSIYVSFKGTGESVLVDSVIATNLATGKSITVPGAGTLILSTGTGILEENDFSEYLKLYPNPIKNDALLTFFNHQAEKTTITVHDLIGKEVYHSSNFLEAGEHAFKVSIGSSGIFLISISGSKDRKCIKAISTESGSGRISITRMGESAEIVQPSDPNRHKDYFRPYSLAFSMGDRILYQGMSGNYSRILTDQTSDSQEYEFEFISCTDLDGRSYPVVQIGEQVWMARNLDYLPKIDTKKDLQSTPSYFVYQYEGSSVQEAKATDNYKNYGVLYNWAAASKGCPEGWHLPSLEEWNQLFNYLYPRAGYKLRETGRIHWSSSTKKNTNEAGFSALPAGELYPYYSEFPVGIYPVFRNLQVKATFWTSSERELTYKDGLSAYFMGLDDSQHGYKSGFEHDFYYTHYWYPSHITNISGYSVRCVRGKKAELVTHDVSEITSNSAICGGTITSDGGTKVTGRGVCWSTETYPSLDDSKTEDGAGAGTFTSELTGLNGDTTYYVRAYAINVVGVSYGQQVSFRTMSGPPSLTTAEVTQVNDSSAVSGGIITNDGAGPITARGVCWSTQENPSIEDNCTNDGTGTGAFVSQITELESSTTYYVRAYATNSYGTGYGRQIRFRSMEGSFTYFGKVYNYQRFGSQFWMVENLAYLPAVSNSSEGSETTKHYYVYGYEGNDTAQAMQTENYRNYGVLYNWPAAMKGASASNSVPSRVRGICPPGWHLPSEAEWIILEDYLINQGYGCEANREGVAKSLASTAGWTLATKPGEIGYDQERNNASGFNAYPAGERYPYGPFSYIGERAHFWTTSRASDNHQLIWFRVLFSEYFNTFESYELGHREEGFSVRCLKD